MSEKARNEVVKAATTIAYRNIKKDSHVFDSYSNEFPNAHLELGENNETVVVEDRPDDWFEIAQQDKDKVGLANIIDIVRRQGGDPFDGRFAYKDEEALDLSGLDPKDPESVKAAVSKGADALKELKATAEKLGVSVDQLISASIDGSIGELVKKSEEVKAKSEEGVK